MILWTLYQYIELAIVPHSVCLHIRWPHPSWPTDFYVCNEKKAYKNYTIPTLYHIKTSQSYISTQKACQLWQAPGECNHSSNHMENATTDPPLSRAVRKPPGGLVTSSRHLRTKTTFPSCQALYNCHPFETRNIEAETKVGRVDDITWIQSHFIHVCDVFVWFHVCVCVQLSCLQFLACSFMDLDPPSTMNSAPISNRKGIKHRLGWSNMVREAENTGQDKERKIQEFVRLSGWSLGGHRLLPSCKSWGMQVPARCSTSCSLQSCTLPEHFPHIKHSDCTENCNYLRSVDPSSISVFFSKACNCAAWGSCAHAVNGSALFGLKPSSWAQLSSSKRSIGIALELRRVPFIHIIVYIWDKGMWVKTCSELGIVSLDLHIIKRWVVILSDPMILPSIWNSMHASSTVGLTWVNWSTGTNAPWKVQRPVFACWIARPLHQCMFHRFI